MPTRPDSWRRPDVAILKLKPSPCTISPSKTAGGRYGDASRMSDKVELGANQVPEAKIKVAPLQRKLTAKQTTPMGGGKGPKEKIDTETGFEQKQDRKRNTSGNKCPCASRWASNLSQNFAPKPFIKSSSNG